MNEKAFQEWDREAGWQKAPRESGRWIDSPKAFKKYKVYLTQLQESRAFPVGYAPEDIGELG